MEKRFHSVSPHTQNKHREIKAKSIIIKELQEKRKVHTLQKTGKTQNLSLKETTDRVDCKKSEGLHVTERTHLKAECEARDWEQASVR